MSSLFDVPTQIGLEIPADVQLEAWQQSQAFSSNPARWQAYLNQISRSLFLSWLQADDPPVAVESNDSATSFWELVNGTVITLGTKRLLLIPDKSIDTSELRVPQEWVDIPELIADYYLAVQINLDEMWLQIWGYTTHEQLKTVGTYDPDDRTYRLASELLIQDLNVLWVVPEPRSYPCLNSRQLKPKIYCNGYLLRRSSNPDSKFLSQCGERWLPMMAGDNGFANSARELLL
jgi:hypothetical protein